MAQRFSIQQFVILFLLALVSLRAQAQGVNSEWPEGPSGYMTGYRADDGSYEDETMEEDEAETNFQTEEEFIDLIAKNKPRAPAFPEKAYAQALAYMKKYPGSFKNERYLTIVDFTKPSHKKRLFLINLKTGGVASYLTSHGQGSDPKHTGRATRFSNSANSHMSSLGFYRTLTTYKGHNGLSLRLQGLSKTNSNAQNRVLVFHKAKYVSERGGRAGRSHGCFAMDPSVLTKVIDKIKGGSLVYAWNGQ